MIIKETDFGAAPEQLFAVLHDRPYSFFLDSAQRAEGLGAYSFIGFDPFLIFRARGDEITLEQDGRPETRHGDPLAELRKLFQRYRGPTTAALPFAGGAVGYFSYEFGLRFEHIPRTSPDDLPIPDLEFGFYDTVIAFEWSTQRTFVVANSAGRPDPAGRARHLEKIVREALVRGPAPSSFPVMASAPEPRANFSKEAYLAAIARIKDYIRAGDVYQVNLTQRFEAPLP